jgi:tetratricopeptide (TPR) repeat protein
MRPRALTAMPWSCAHDTGYRQLEGNTLGNLGNCHYRLGDYRQAIDLHTQALAIGRDIGHRYGEANALNYLGRAQLASVDPRQAVTLLEQAVAVADTTGDIEPAVEARSGLARPSSSWVIRRRRSPRQPREGNWPTRPRSR